MARRPFGGGTTDFVARNSGGTLIVSALTVTFWTASSGGTQITDLLNGAGSAVTSMVTDGNGQLSAFQGPAAGTAFMWADGGSGGARQLIYASDTPSRLALLESSTVASLVDPRAFLSSRRFAQLSEGPPTMAGPSSGPPVIIEWTDTGPWLKSTTGAGHAGTRFSFAGTSADQLSDSIQFWSDEDVVHLLPGAWDAGWGVNTRQTTPLDRGNGFITNGGRNVVICGGTIGLSSPYYTTIGSQTVGLANKNRSVLVDHGNNKEYATWAAASFGGTAPPVQVNGTIWITGLKIAGAWNYESFNFRGFYGTGIKGTGSGTRIVVQDNLQAAVAGTDGPSCCRYVSTGVGVGNHDGGDVFQLQAINGNYAAHLSPPGSNPTIGGFGVVIVDGLEAHSAWFQGLFCKSEPGNVVNPPKLRNVAMYDYRGPGGAYYINHQQTDSAQAGMQLQLDNCWLEPGPQASNAGNVTAGSTTFGANTSIDTQVFYPHPTTGSGATIGGHSVDSIGSYGTAPDGSFLSHMKVPGQGIVRQGTPPGSVLSSPNVGTTAYRPAGYLDAANYPV